MPIVVTDADSQLIALRSALSDAVANVHNLGAQLDAARAERDTLQLEVDGLAKFIQGVEQFDAAVAASADVPIEQKPISQPVTVT